MWESLSHNVHFKHFRELFYNKGQMNKVDFVLCWFSCYSMSGHPMGFKLKKSQFFQVFAIDTTDYEEKILKI